MAIDLGGIYVSFTGDTSKLEADIARGTALAKQGGADMSAAFTASAATAYKFSTAIDSVTASTQKLISAQRQLAGASQSSSQAAIAGLQLEQAELAALFDLEFDQTAKQRTPVAPAAASPGFAGVDPASVVSVTELGAASEASSVQVAALGEASAKSAIPIAELGAVSKSSALSTAGLATASAAAARPVAALGTAAASTTAPLAGMAVAANSPIITTAAGNAAKLGTAVTVAGAAAKTAAPQFGAMTAAQQAAATGFAGLAGNATVAAVATTRTIAAVTQFGRAAQVAGQQTQSFVGLIPGLGRAAETFINLIPGLGAGILRIFPVLGAFALAEGIYRIGQSAYNALSGTEELKKSLEGLAQAGKDADDKLSHLVSTVDNLGVHAIGRDLGPVEAAKARANQLKLEAGDAQREIAGLVVQLIDLDKHGADLTRKGLGSAAKRVLVPGADTAARQENTNEIDVIRKKIQGLQDDIAAKVKEAESSLGDAGKLAAEESAQTALAGISNQIAANRRLADAKRQAVENTIALDRQAEDAQIAGAESAHVRSIATAEQDLQIARQRAVQLKAIDDAELTAHVAMLQRKAAAETVGKDRQQIATIRTTVQGEIAAATEDNARKQIALDANVAAAAAKVGQVRATVARQSKVELDELVRESQALLDRNTAQLEEAVTRLEEIRSQAATRNTETQAKSGGELQQLQIQHQKLEAERQYDLQVGHSLNEQIAQQSTLADFDAKGRAARIAGLRDEQAIADAAQQTARAKADAAIFSGDEKEALRSGQEEVRNKTKSVELTAEIARLEAEGANAALNAEIERDKLKQQKNLGNQIRSQIGDGSFIDKSTVAGAHLATGAIEGISSALAKAAVQGGNLGRSLVQAGRSLATSTLTSLLKAGLEAVLRSLLNLIPAFGAVKAAQTAAAAGAAAAQKAIAVASVTTAAGEGAAWAFESVIAALPFPVNVAAAPGVAAATFAQILGFGAFAEGGRPEPGKPALIGEKGPELWIPDQPGVIVPAGKFNIQQGSAVNNPTRDILGGLYAGRPSLFNAGLPPPDKTLSNTPPPGARNVVASDGTTIHLHGAQFHGVQNVRELMREISQYAKTSSARFSPYAK